MLWAPPSAAHRTGGLTAAHYAAVHSVPGVHSQARQQRCFCSHEPAAFQQQQTWQKSSLVSKCRQRRCLVTTNAAQQSTATAAEDLLIVGTWTCIALVARTRADPSQAQGLSRCTANLSVRACRPRRPGMLRGQGVAGSASQRGSSRPNKHPQQPCAVQHSAAHRLSLLSAETCKLGSHA